MIDDVNFSENCSGTYDDTKNEVGILSSQESYDINGDRPKLGEWLASELGWKQWQGDSAHLCVLTPLEIKARFFHHP